MTDADYESLAVVIATAVAKATAPLVARVAALEASAKLGAAVEKHQRTMSYRGLWSKGYYNAGDSVVFNGRAWRANRPTSSTPGADGSWARDDVR